jgi:MarR family transcriptional regulator, organic hydroperoxide resistance regulator
MYRNYLNHAIFEVCYIYGMSTPTVGTTAAAKDAWALFWRIFSADKPRRMATLSELGLAPMQSMALMQLRPGEPMTMSAMAHALQCDNSNVTGIADRLEAMGLIERRAAEHDRRVKTLVITELGKQVRDQVERRMSVPPPPLAGLSEDDAIALRDILQRALDL